MRKDLFCNFKTTLFRVILEKRDKSRIMLPSLGRRLAVARPHAWDVDWSDCVIELHAPEQPPVPLRLCVPVQLSAQLQSLHLSSFFTVVP